MISLSHGDHQGKTNRKKHEIMTKLINWKKKHISSVSQKFANIIVELLINW